MTHKKKPCLSFFALLSLAIIFILPVKAGPALHSPQVRRYSSENDIFYVEITRSKPTGLVHLSTNTSNNCKAILFKRASKTGYVPVWSEYIVGAELPDKVLVANSGKYVIAFYSFGVYSANNALAIYDQNGKLVKQYKLNELASPEEIRNMPSIEVSTNWYGETFVDKKRNCLAV